MDLIAELIFYLTIKPLLACCEVFAGILTTTDCPSLVRLKKIAGAFLVVAAIGMLLAIFAPWFSVDGWPRFWGFAASFVLLVIAGVIGNYIQANA
ncbi:MAG: hypothetical protein ABJZ55_05680 [Fuerstiella sp.]